MQSLSGAIISGAYPAAPWPPASSSRGTFCPFGVMEGSCFPPSYRNRRGGSAPSVVPPLSTSRYRPAHYSQHNNFQNLPDPKTQPFKGELEVTAARAGPRATGPGHPHALPLPARRTISRDIVYVISRITCHGARLATHSPRTSARVSAWGDGEACVSDTHTDTDTEQTLRHRHRHTDTQTQTQTQTQQTQTHRHRTDTQTQTQTLRH